MTNPKSKLLPLTSFHSPSSPSHPEAKPASIHSLPLPPLIPFLPFSLCLCLSLTPSPLYMTMINLRQVITIYISSRKITSSFPSSSIYLWTLVELIASTFHKYPDWSIPNGQLLFPDVSQINTATPLLTFVRLFKFLFLAQQWFLFYFLILPIIYCFMFSCGISFLNPS